jgi:hypothetical protein
MKTVRGELRMRPRSTRKIVGVLVLAGAWPIDAHETITTKLTWSAEISRIFERRCIGCHGSGRGPAMPLTSYAEVRPWAVAIREEVLERRMPPWSAVEGFGEFRNDEGLSAEEISRIAAWVTGGAPEGNPALLPPMHPHDAVAPRPGGRPVRVRDGTILPAGLLVTAIQALSVPEGNSVKVSAERPDGSAEPLLWVRDFRDGSRAYVYRNRVRLPSGTRIHVYPAGPFYFRLFTTSLPAK